MSLSMAQLSSESPTPAEDDGVRRQQRLQGRHVSEEDVRRREELMRFVYNMRRSSRAQRNNDRYMSESPTPAEDDGVRRQQPLQRHHLSEEDAQRRMDEMTRLAYIERQSSRAQRNNDRYMSRGSTNIQMVNVDSVRHGFERGMDQYTGSRGAPPAAKAVIETLRTIVIEPEEESRECAVCTDAVGVGEVAKELPCGHGFHQDCIVQWLEVRNSCPLCRFELPTDDFEYEKRKKRVMRRTFARGSSSGLSDVD